MAFTLLLLVLAFVYAEAGKNQYAFDDLVIVRDNSVITSASSPGPLFSSPYWNPDIFPHRGLYRPLSLFSFWLSHRFFEDPVFVDHTINVCLHAAVVFLVFLFLALCGASLPWAFLLTSIYAFHPVHTEVVAGLVGRSDLLATLFMFGGLVLILHWKQISWWQGVLLFFLSLLSLLSKESSATMLLLFPLVLWLLRDKAGCLSSAWYRQMLFTFTALLAAFLVYLGLRYAVLGQIGVSSAGRGLPGETMLQQRWYALAYLPFFLQKFFVPLPLSPDYASGFFTFGSLEESLRAWSSILGLSLLMAMVIFQLRRRRTISLPLGGALLFLLAILPVSNLLLIIGTPFAERFLYLSMPFFLLLFVSVRRQRMYFILAIIVLPLLAGITWARVPVWKNNRTLFQAGVEDVPRNYHLRMSLASELLYQKEMEKAQTHFLIATKLKPGLYAPWMGLGKISFDAGEYAQAQKHYLQALDLAPPSKQNAIRYNLSLTKQRLKTTLP